MIDFTTLLNKLDNLETKKTYSDNSDKDEYWMPTRDKAGNASAVIRFLPNKDTDEIPFVRLFTHSFKNPVNNRWYIQNSLSTINMPDPLGEMNSELWNTGIEENKKIVQSRKRKLNYISNILVVKDIGNPANNGKVFKYKYGKKVMEKIVNAAKPNLELDPDAKPIHAFDPRKGANFSLQIEIVSDFPNYDKSQFQTPGPLFQGNDEKIQAVLDQCYNLNELIEPSKFKTYDELKKNLDWVLGITENKKIEKATNDSLVDVAKEIAEDKKKVEAQKPVKATVAAKTEDDDFDFQSLLDD